MNLAEAESIVALHAEIETASELRSDRAAFASDWRVQFAAERVIERLFQAAEAVGSEKTEAYFGSDGARYLRGLRNRLAHNYLAIDHEVLWDTIDVDLPQVAERMAPDVARATTILADAVANDAGDEEAWRGTHLRSTSEPE